MNVAVAKIHELASEISNFSINTTSDNWSQKEAVTILIKVSEPIMPHLAEECWSQIGNLKSIIEERWPQVESDLLTDSQSLVIIQVNGKKRADLKLPKDTNELDVFKQAMSLTNIKNYIPEENLIKKKIFVPNKILNIVI